MAIMKILSMSKMILEKGIAPSFKSKHTEESRTKISDYGIDWMGVRKIEENQVYFWPSKLK